jgi:hypothetical protein
MAARVELPAIRATTTADDDGCPHVKVVPDETTVCVPLNPTAMGSELPATIESCVCDAVVPKLVPEVVPVIAKSSDRLGSQDRTGMATVLNFEPTDVEVTVDEITTSCLPDASAVALVESFRTVTVNPSAVSRCWKAASAALSVAFPTTKSAAREVSAPLSKDCSSCGAWPQPISAVSTPIAMPRLSLLVPQIRSMPSAAFDRRLSMRIRRTTKRRKVPRRDPVPAMRSRASFQFPPIREKVSGQAPRFSSDETPHWLLAPRGKRRTSRVHGRLYPAGPRQRDGNRRRDG